MREMALMNWHALIDQSKAVHSRVGLEAHGFSCSERAFCELSQSKGGDLRGSENRLCFESEVGLVRLWRRNA